MATQIEADFKLTPPVPRLDSLAPVTPLSLMDKAIDRGISVEQLQILQDMYFKQQARDAEMEFNRAMNACQVEVGRVAPNAFNKQTQSKWATYDKLDAALRPIYTKHGFCLSFSTDPSVSPETEMTRVLCYLSHREGHTRTYHQDVPCDGKGAKGGDVMTKAHARGAADSYGMRYLLKMIFNIAIGEDDNDGNGAAPSKHMEDLYERLEWIANRSTLPEVQKIGRAAYDEAKKLGDQNAMKKIADAVNAKKVEFQG